MQEEIIIDGVNVAGCEYLCTNQMGNNCLNHNRGFSMNCKNTSDCYYKQLQRLQETLKHIENGRKQKANKLKRIEEIVTHCIQGGFTDEFIQEIFDICREYEEV